MATHSSIFACRIPGTEEPGGLSSMGSHRVRHDWSDLAAAAASMFVNFITLFSLGFINLKMVSVIYYIVTTIIKC